MGRIKISFGKYKGQTFEEIVEHSPMYIIWLHRNINTLDIPSKVLVEAYSSLKDEPHDFIEDLSH